MAKNVEVTLTLDTKGFDRKLNNAKKSMGGFATGGNVAKGSLIGLAARFAPVAAGVVAVGAAFKGLGDSVRTASDFQNIEVVLTNLTGSAAKGKAALNQLIEVAKDLPLSFKELAAAQPALATISPTLGDLERNTRLAADIAGQFGISFTDAAGQLQKAFSGGIAAADIFREKGVKSAAGFEEGVTYSVEETIAKLKEFGGEIEGAAENINQTLGGALSQVGDKFTLFRKSLGEAILPEFQSFLQEINSLLGINEDSINAFAEDVGTGLVNSLKAGGQAIAFLIDLFFSFRNAVTRIFNELFPNFGEFFDGFKEIGKQALDFIITKFFDLGEAIGGLIDYIPGVDSGMTDFFKSLREDFNNTEGDISSLAKTFGEEFDNIFVTETRARDAFNQFVSNVDSGAQKLRKAKEEAEAAAEAVTAEATIAIAQNAQKAKEEAEAAADAFTSLKEAFADVTSIEEYNLLLETLQEMLAADKISMDEFRKAKQELDDALSEGQEPLLNFIDTLGSAQKALADDLATAFLEGKRCRRCIPKFLQEVGNTNDIRRT